MSSGLVRFASLLIVALGLCAVPDRSEAAPANGAVAPKPAKKPAGGAAKPAKDPDDDDDAARKPAATPAPAAAPGKAGTAGAPVTGAADPAGAAAPATTPVPEDLPPSDMEGTDENPEAPFDYDAPRPDPTPVVKARPAGYPVEEVMRPLTLPRFMTEVALDTRVTFNPFINGSALRADFGVTPEVQVGLVYNIGGIYEDASRSTAFNTGKAVAITGAYKIKEWLSASLAVPMYLDPFAASVTLGAPMKFRFADRYALIIAEDVVDIRITEFVPSLTSEAENEINAGYIDTNTRTSEGTFRFSGAGVYQYKPDLAITARLVVSIRDFDSKDLGYLLKVGAQKAVRKNLDVQAVLGFDDLGNADETFGLQLGAAFRI